MKIRIKPLYIQFFFVCSISLSYLYLVDKNDGILGVSFENISYVICMLWCLYWIVRIRVSSLKYYRYLPWIIGMGSLVFFSILSSARLYDQALTDSLGPQRRIIVWLFAYVAFSNLIMMKNIDKEVFVSILEKIGILQLALCFIQFFLGANVQFLHVHIIRNVDRGLRYYYMPTLFVFLFFIELDKFVKNKGKNKVFNITIIIAIFLEVIVVQKFRMTSTGLLICLILFIMLMRTKQQSKVFYIITGFIVVSVLLNTDFFQNIIEVIFDGGDAYLATRSRGRDFYFAAIRENMLLGCGYPSTNNIQSLESSGYNQGLLLNDNGIIGFVYLYGLIGLLWFATLWIKMIKDGWRIYKNYNSLAFFLMPIFWLVTCITEAHWYWEHGFFMLILFLVIQECYVNGINNKKSRRMDVCENKNQ